MEMTPFNLLVIDVSSHALLLIDALTGQALSKMPYPPEYMPVGLAVTSDLGKAYLPAVDQSSGGAVFAVNLKACSLYQLPIKLPHPLQFALAPDNNTVYFTAPDGILYSLDTTALKLTTCGQAANQACTCIGLAVSSENVYSAWESDNSGVIAVFSQNGELTNEYPVSGIPTNIVYDKSGVIMVPFTSNGTYGEGLFIVRIHENCPPTILTIQCPACANSNGAYPCQATLAPDGQTAYVVNEDSGSVTIIDLTTGTVVDHFSVGRSISTLTVLPDAHFGVASSNMFGDLALIDLVNGRLLSFTTDNHEFLSSIAVLPR